VPVGSLSNRLEPWCNRGEYGRRRRSHQGRRTEVLCAAPLAVQIGWCVNLVCGRTLYPDPVVARRDVAPLEPSAEVKRTRFSG
jgi:hypothetical protein